jgi:hypothetical protein
VDYRVSAWLRWQGRQRPPQAAERSQARKAESVSDLLDLFMANHIRPKRKRRTVILFDGYIKNHVRPALGRVAAPALTRAELERLHRTIGKTHPVTANRVIALVAAVYAFGQRNSILPKATANPAANIEKFINCHRRETPTNPGPRMGSR